MVETGNTLAEFVTRVVSVIGSRRRAAVAPILTTKNFPLTPLPIDYMSQPDQDGIFQGLYTPNGFRASTKNHGVSTTTALSIG